MKNAVVRAGVVLLLTGVAAGAAADGRYHGGHGGYGHGGGHRGGHGGTSYGFYLGTPLLWGPAYRPYPYGYGYGYAPPTVVIQQEPTVYIQRQPVVAVAPPAQGPAPLWFYCPDPAGYYPYVEQCRRPWVSVDPSAVAPQR